MCTPFYVIYLVILIGLLLGIAGIIVLVYGLMNKKNRMTLSGSIMTGIAIIIFMTGIFFGVRKAVHFGIEKCKSGIMFEKQCGMHRQMYMQMDSSMMKCDSTMMKSDSGKCCMKKGMKMNCCKRPGANCDKKKCDAQKCPDKGKQDKK